MNMVLRRVSASPVRRSRPSRRPAHTFNIGHKPFVIAPFLLAPVLPGDSLARMVLQCRAVTDPIKNPLIGWWLEHYFFYVKLSQLEAGLTDMVSDLTFAPATFHSAAVAANYSNGGLDYAQQCLDTIVEHYFRLEDEAEAAHKLLDDRPLASVNHAGIFDSLVSTASREYADPEIILPDTGAKLTGSDIAQLLRDWEIAREERPELTYEQFLELHAGIRDRETMKPRPELLRYSRAWQLPTNTVNPTDGSVASAVSWVVTERADKARYFVEPGFIFGVTVSRPKVYLGKQNQAAANIMDFAAAWVPGIGLADPSLETLREYAEETGVLSQTMGDGAYWLDVRDLLMHGDQWLDDMTATDRNLLALPLGNVTNIGYPSSADVNGLFAGTAYHVRQDGVVSFDLKSASRDRTPSRSP